MKQFFGVHIRILIVVIAVFQFGFFSSDGIAQEKEEVISLNIMTWNIWGKLNMDPKYTIDGKTARERVIEIIKDSGADIITMTETYGSAADIAAALNFEYYTPKKDANLAIFSRYPMENAGVVKGLSAFSFISATVNLPDNKKIRVYNIWLTSGGRHIVEIKNKELSDSEFNEGDENRYDHIQELLEHDDFKRDLADKNEMPLIVAGDFNCVSHLDHTQETRNKGLNYNRIVPNKVSIAMQEIGFTDTYRATNPVIESESLGHTWTTVGIGYQYVSGEGFVPVEVNPSPEYRNPYARIDFIYCTGNDIVPVKSRTIIHHASNESRSFPEFPSDHAAVLTEFKVE